MEVLGGDRARALGGARGNGAAGDRGWRERTDGQAWSGQKAGKRGAAGREGAPGLGRVSETQRGCSGSRRPARRAQPPAPWGPRALGPQCEPANCCAKSPCGVRAAGGLPEQAGRAFGPGRPELRQGDASGLQTLPCHLSSCLSQRPIGWMSAWTPCSMSSGSPSPGGSLQPPWLPGIGGWPVTLEPRTLLHVPQVQGSAQREGGGVSVLLLPKHSTPNPLLSYQGTSLGFRALPKSKKISLRVP